VRGCLPRPREKGGADTGPSPVDRGKTGSTHHLICDGGGIPLAVTLTGGNRNDIGRKVKNRARGQFRSVLCPTKRDRSRCRGLSPYSPGGTTGPTPVACLAHQIVLTAKSEDPRLVDALRNGCTTQFEMRLPYVHCRSGMTWAVTWHPREPSGHGLMLGR
jgi:hypothetical protein